MYFCCSRYDTIKSAKRKTQNQTTKIKKRKEKKKMKTTTATNEIKRSKPVKKIAAGAIATVMIGAAFVLPSVFNNNKDSGLLGRTSITASADSTKTGRFGDLAYWTLDGTGRLIISGKGAMPDFINDDKTPWRDFRSDIKAVIIEDGITNVGTYAFSYCTHLTSVKFGKGITTIGREAFNGCTNLKKADIPEGVTTIDSDAFHFCTAIESVTIPSTVTTIENDAFYGCKNCKSIDMRVKDPVFLEWKDSNDDFMPNKQTKCSIAKGADTGYKAAFGDSVNVTFVADKDNCGDNATWTLDDNGKLTVSGTGAIYDFAANFRAPWDDVSDKIKTVEIEGGITRIGKDSFCQCQNLSSVIINEGVTTIGDGAFAANDAITEINIPASVTTIEHSAFGGCNNLKTVTFAEGSKLTSLGTSAFQVCTALESINLPKGLTAIGDNTFSYCKALKSVTIPEGVTTIGNAAFCGCYALTEATIPSTVTKICGNAFEYCNNCKDVYLNVADPAKLTWEKCDRKQFMPDKATKCHVASDKVDDFTAKFGSTVNVTFVAAE